MPASKQLSSKQATPPLEKIGYLQQFLQTIQSTELTGLLADVVNARWFDWFAISGFSIKLLAYIVRFATAKNKNIYQSGLLGWGIFQGLVTGFAIGGTILAATTFTLLTPAIIVGSLVLDMLRNLALTIWHTGKLAKLYYSLRKQIKVDPVANAKYQQLKTELVAKIKHYTWGFVLSFVMSAATAVAFLFPHIGLGFVAAASAVVGGVKISLALALGVAAVALPFLPLIGKALKGIARKIKSCFAPKPIADKTLSPNPSSQMTSTHAIRQQLTTSQSNEIKPSLSTDDLIEAQHTPTDDSASEHAPLLRARNIDFNSLITHRLQHNNQRKLRSVLIDQAPDQVTAKALLLDAIDEKIKQLDGELTSHPNSLQKHKRTMKLYAMFTVKNALKWDEKHDSDDKSPIIWNKHETNYNNFVAKTTRLTKTIDEEGSIMGMQDNYSETIRYIEKHMSGVYQSFFTNYGDTEDILKAYATYARKFPSSEEAPPTSNSAIKVV